MVQVHAPRGVEVRVLSWAPRFKFGAIRRSRKTPSILVITGFFVFLRVEAPPFESKLDIAFRNEALAPDGQSLSCAPVRTAQRPGCSDIAVPAWRKENF